MTIIQQFLDEQIPVILLESDETNGTYSFEKMTLEQQKRVREIFDNAVGIGQSVNFDLPIVAPSITVSEIIVQSPKPKDKALDALSHLVGLAKGKDKPLAEIILNLVVYIDDLEKRVKKKNI